MIDIIPNHNAHARSPVAYTYAVNTRPAVPNKKYVTLFFGTCILNWSKNPGKKAYRRPRSADKQEPDDYTGTG